MTREEAKKLIFSQWQSFLEDYIDYGGISEAYKMAIEALSAEPCEDAISREAVINAIYANGVWENAYNLTSNKIKKAVEALPSIQPIRPKGRWIFPNPSTEMICECSLCGGNGRAFGKDNYCPNCGADMRG